MTVLGQTMLVSRPASWRVRELTLQLGSRIVESSAALSNTPSPNARIAVVFVMLTARGVL